MRYIIQWGFFVSNSSSSLSSASGNMVDTISREAYAMFFLILAAVNVGVSSGSVSKKQLSMSFSVAYALMKFNYTLQLSGGIWIMVSVLVLSVMVGVVWCSCSSCMSSCAFYYNFVRWCRQLLLRARIASFVYCASFCSMSERSPDKIEQGPVGRTLTFSHRRLLGQLVFIAFQHTTI